MFLGRYADVFKGDENWQGIASGGETYKLEFVVDLRAEPALLRRHDDEPRR
jgi:hypothetical protein